MIQLLPLQISNQISLDIKRSAMENGQQNMTVTKYHMRQNQTTIVDTIALCKKGSFDINLEQLDQG